MLLDSDIEYLEGKGWRWTFHEDATPPVLVIHGYQLPPGFSAANVELLIEVPDAYPDSKLDMFWLYPIVELAAGGAPRQSQERREFEGKTWQRFSRHPEIWRPESDTLVTYLTWIHNHLLDDVRVGAA